MSPLRRNWGNEFADIDFGDARLNARMIGLMEGWGGDFGASISELNLNWANQKASYRFFSNERVEEREIIRTHREQSLGRAKKYEWLIAVQDSSVFNFHKYRDNIFGLGKIGSGLSNSYGLQMHASLLLSNTGETLGLVDWSMYAPGRNIQSDVECMAEGETAKKWFKHLQIIAEARAELGKKIVMVADREADITGLFLEAKRRGVDIVIRTKSLRRIIEPERGNLRHYLQRQAPQFKYKIKVEKRYELLGNKSKRNKRAMHEVRTVELKVHYAQVQLHPANKKHGVEKATDEDLKFFAVFVEEINPSVKSNSVEWILITTLPVNNQEDARNIIEIYRKRWNIEEYFKTLKSGCLADDIRLSTAKKLSRYICMKSVIATEVFQLKELSRQRPSDCCEEVLSPLQWKVLVLLIKQIKGQKKTVPKKPPTLIQATYWIGQLGGHLGRTRDGPPGVKTLWRGYQRLLFHVEGYGLAKKL